MTLTNKIYCWRLYLNLYSNKQTKNCNQIKLELNLNQGIQNLRNSFLRGFPLPFNVETLQAFGALFQIPHYYRKFSHCKFKMLFYVKF
jgi:hypothetical protein